ncbi:MAG: hypothetical protein K2W97_07170 [Chthoniobacterales bacterium]|nr:hypothetical protein [Chthoniobacterales bacterium]
MIFSFQVRAIPMFGGEEKEPATSSGKSPADTPEQRRRETDAASLNAPVNEAACAEACGAVDPSLQNDSLNTAIDEAVAEENRQQEEHVVLALENFRTAAADPALTRAERLIVDPESGLIRPRSEADRKIKGKNETIIAALKGALHLEFPMFQPALIDKIVDEELPHSSTWSMFETLQGKPALSTETLQRILEKADNAMAERAFVEGNFFTLQHFRNALAQPENKGEQRLIIRGQGASALIVAQVGSNHVEDAIIRKTFKRALEREGHRRDFVHELTSEALPYLSMFAKARKIRTPLSFEKLNTILQQADDAMAEIKLLQATRSVVPLSATAENRAAARTLFRSSIENFFSRLGIQNDAIAAGISAAVIPKSAEELAAEHAAATQQATWEKNETEKVLCSFICRGRNADAFKEHYREAEAAAIASEAYQNQAMEARWNAEGKAQYLTQARAFFQEVKALLDEKRELSEFNESTLSKIAQGAELTSVVLGMVNVPFVSLKGIADAVSTFATFADQRLTIAEAQRAYKRLQVAIQEAETATQGNEQVEEAASAMHAETEKIEALKKQEDHDETIFLSNIARAPLDFSDDAAWRQWATELACEADPADESEATITAHLLYKQGKKNPSTIHELIGTLWGERLALSQREFQRLVETTPHDEEYESAQKKEIETKTAASTARARLEEAAQAKSQWLSKRDQLRDEKKILEDQLRTDAEHRGERQGELEAKRREFSAHQAKKESIDDAYQAAAAEAKNLTTAAAIAHADAFEKFKIFNSTKQLHARITARLQAAAEVDQKVFDDILIAKACSKEAQAREAAAAALERGNEKAAALLYQRVDAWREAGVLYDKAIKEQTREHIEAATTYRKSAQAYEAQAEALVRGDTSVAKIQEQIARAWKEAGVLHNNAIQEQTQEHIEAAATYRKSAQANEAHAAALMRGDTTAANLQKQIASAWKEAGVDWILHNNAIQKQTQEYIEAAIKYRKRAQANEARAAALMEIVTTYRKSAQAKEARIAALMRGDTTAADLQEEIARAWQEEAESYSYAATELAYGNTNGATAYLKGAQAYEAQAEALIRGDIKVAKIQEQIANAFAGGYSGAGYLYGASAREYSSEKANLCIKKAQAREARAKALIQQLNATDEKITDVKSKSTTTPSQQKTLPQQEKAPGTAPEKKGKGNCTVS